jgi:hypothetical protein
VPPFRFGPVGNNVTVKGKEDKMQNVASSPSVQNLESATTSRQESTDVRTCSTRTSLISWLPQIRLCGCYLDLVSQENFVPSTTSTDQYAKI